MTTSINLDDRNLSSTLRRAGAFADRSSIGNNNYKLDTKEEIALFKNLIKQGFNYDFNLETSSDEINNQDLELKKIIKQNPNSVKFFNLQCDSEYDLFEFVPENAGIDAGKETAKALKGFTFEKDSNFINETIERLTTNYTPELNKTLTTNFLKGYGKGLFEQLGTELDSSKITNKKATEVLTKILQAVPDDKQNTSEFETVKQALENINSKPSDELFKDDYAGSWKRIFGKSSLKDLDNSIAKLFDLE